MADRSIIASDDRSLLERLVLRRGGNRLPRGVDHLLAWRLKQVAWRHNLSGLDELFTLLRDGASPGLEDEVVEQMLDTDTWFFRDDDFFQGIHATVLPDLMKSRAAERFIKFWAPGVGSGQEVYSLILTVRHHFPAMRDWDLRVLGTDILESALQRAQAATYADAEVQRGLPLSLLTRYFSRSQGQWVLDPRIRAQASFKVADLMDGFGPNIPSFDLVCVRNLLANFDPDLRVAAIRSAARQVAPGGFLVLGSSDQQAGLKPEPRVFRPLGNGFYKAFGQM